VRVLISDVISYCASCCDMGKISVSLQSTDVEIIFVASITIVLAAIIIVVLRKDSQFHSIISHTNNSIDYYAINNQ